jgi:hypothetical protein
VVGHRPVATDSALIPCHASAPVGALAALLSKLTSCDRESHGQRPKQKPSEVGPCLSDVRLEVAKALVGP